MSDDDKTPANGASNTSKDNAVEEMTAEDVVETVSDAILSLSSNAKDLAAKMDSESRDVAAAAEEIVENMKDAADGEPLKSDETASGDGAAEPTKKHHHSRTASGPLLAAAAAVATAAETAAKSVETAAKDLAGRINLEPVLTTINEAAGKASEAAKDLVAKVDLEQVKQTAEQAAERAMDAAGRAATAMDGAQRNLAKKLNIEPMEFAPLNVPMERRRQTFAVLLWALIAPISWFLIFYCVFLTSSWLIRTLFLAYCAWIYVDDAPIRGARPSALFRHNPLWRWFVDYYPASLIKTADLDPSKNYLFGYHPHGILGFGAWATFATNGTGFEEAFPGVTPHLCTLNINFKTPFAREWLMAHGVISADKKSILNVWKKGKGESVAIVIGGAEEGYYAKPGTADLVLNKRLGFVKLALSQGVAIVPVGWNV